MKIKDVIKTVANLLQLNNVLDANLDNIACLDTQTQRDISLIVSCINMVLCDVATDFLPLKAREKIIVQNGSFDLKTLTHDFHKLLSIETIEKYLVENEVLKIKDGSYVITYSYLPKVIELSMISQSVTSTNNETYENTQQVDDNDDNDDVVSDDYTTGSSSLVYEIGDNGSGSYVDDNAKQSDNVEIIEYIEDVDSRLTIYALSFGVAEEFCLISGNYAESEMWNSKYQNALNVCVRSGKIPKLKSRRWI